jgi:uncharacterized protein DUF4168
MASIAWKEIALAAAMGAALPQAVVAQSAEQQAQIFSDGELSAYAKARAEIEPIQLAQMSAPAHARGENYEAQIDAVLARNGLTREDYDAIATVAMADQALQAKIAQLALAEDTPEGA